MAKNKLYPHGNTMKCDACGHGCIRDRSEYPPKGTPSDKIRIEIGSAMCAMECAGCHCYTIYCISQAQCDYYYKQYFPVDEDIS